MPRWKQRHRKPEGEHTNVAVRVDRYEARATAEVNHYADNPQYAWRDIDDEPLLHFLTHLEIIGTSTHPEHRAGHVYQLTVYGQDAPSSDVYATLNQVHARDKYNVPQYRAYRGKQVPVYVPPKGMGTIDKVRGELRWTGAIFVRPRFVNDLLVLLGQGRPLFMEIHEHKHERTRWVHSVSVQTTDPAQE